VPQLIVAQLAISGFTEKHRGFFFGMGIRHSGHGESPRAVGSTLWPVSPTGWKRSRRPNPNPGRVKNTCGGEGHRDRCFRNLSALSGEVIGVKARFDPEK